MRTTVIFSGTTEGRVLSEALSKEKIDHTVSVATDYGKEMMGNSSYARIHTGRMDAEEMVSFLSGLNMGKEGIIIDATHPYALEVTANIKSAAETLGISCERVVREEEYLERDGISVYGNIRECGRAMEDTEGNILLTTGSKELRDYFESVSPETGERTCVRILPSPDSLKACMDVKMDPGRVIAMQGPFSQELNEAIFKQYEIKHLITKDGGAAGGFREKAEAAARCGVHISLIKRPVREEGISVREAFKMITGHDMRDLKEPLKINLIGGGMGSRGSRTGEAEEALRRSDAVFGSERLLRTVSSSRKYEMFTASGIIPVLEREGFREVSVLFSGDTGFNSGAKGLLKALKEWREDSVIRVIPGISSVSYLSAKLGESYDDACLFSIHGKGTDKNLKLLMDRVRHEHKVFLLVSGADDVRKIAEMLLDLDIKGHMAVGAGMSGENETVKIMSFPEAAGFGSEDVVTALIINDEPERQPVIDVRRDSEFIRGKTPMTKECVRHESIIRLGLRRGDLFYDIGGGTGSVAIEAASLDPGIRVFTLERDRDALDLIRENLRNRDLYNIEVVEGDAELLLPEMEKPDCVFIGGSGGKLSRIVDILSSKGKGIRFVINAVTMETMEEVRKITEKYEPDDERAVMMSVSDVEKAGSYHMMKAGNPVWIFSFTI